MRSTPLTTVALCSALIPLLNGCGGTPPAGGGGTPTAAITVTEGTQVTAGTTLHLVGGQSQPSTGQTITAYQWTVEAPNGASTTFSPSASTADPTFLVDTAGSYTFRLTVFQGATACTTPATVTVQVQAAGAPTAVATVTEGGEVPAGTTLHLVGDQSQAAAGQTITAYEWTVEAPGGATGTFVPSAQAANPTYVVDVVGTYTFHLTVYQGAMSSTAPAEAAVQVEAPIAPMPVITVQEGLQVGPLTTLHLSASQSVPVPGSAIDAWEWTLEGPAGSVTTFWPSASVQSPTLEANVAGTYTFRLTVHQGQLVSATPAEATVTVVPSDTIHVELTWETPNDPDPTDTGAEAGSDMDLHFTHPLAPARTDNTDLDGDGEADPYFDTLYDCYWFNPQPHWGANATADDPSLDRDDTDGAGPEVISLTTPELNAVYRVAVHYWRDHGYGHSLATVRVRLNGTLAFERTGIELASRDLWCVADINATAGTVTGLTAPAGSGDWIVHNYVHPDFP